MRKMFSLKSAAIAFAILGTAAAAQAATTQYRLEATSISTNSSTGSFSIVFDDLDMDMRFSLNELIDFSGVSVFGFQTQGGVLAETLSRVPDTSNFTDGGNSLWQFRGFFSGGGFTFARSVSTASYTYSLNPVPSTVPLPAGGLLLVTGLIGMAALRRRLL